MAPTPPALAEVITHRILPSLANLKRINCAPNPSPAMAPPDTCSPTPVYTTIKAEHCISLDNEAYPLGHGSSVEDIALTQSTLE